MPASRYGLDHPDSLTYYDRRHLYRTGAQPLQCLVILEVVSK